MDNIKVINDTCLIIKNIINESIDEKRRFLNKAVNIEMIDKAAQKIVEAYSKGAKVIVFGNGGSAADSQHMAAELIVRFEKDRKSLPCIALNANTSNLTATGNDYSFDQIFHIFLHSFFQNQSLFDACLKPICNWRQYHQLFLQ